MPFQTFDPPNADPAKVEARVARLRALFADLGVDGILLPREDAYLSEELHPSEARLQFMTGFSGSAGRAVILADAALFATDGRYTLQAAAQVPGALFHVVDNDADATRWLKSHCAGKTLGYAPLLHTRAAITRLTERVPDLTLTPLDAHPVDTLWDDRPGPPTGTITAHPQALAGQSVTEKLTALRDAMEEDALLIAAPDAASWLFNWRGSDVAHTPLALARAFVPKTGPATVFVDAEKLTDAARATLADVAEIAPVADYPAALGTLAAGKSVRAAAESVADGALSAIEAAGRLVKGKDPSARQKAIKNPAEIAGMRAAHVRDGAAMVRFLAAVDEIAVGATEIDLCERLEAERVKAGAVDLSFPTICGAGPNGAIVHYRVDTASNRTIREGDAILIDSGGQYPDGTTDITRTICAGTPAQSLKTAFTAVLKGHIAIAAQKFPLGASGAELDTLARAALWQTGADYAHGTGHGVGAALSVHEGPAGISKRSREPLAAGMILSNEPGFYGAAFGIRIENLVLVREPETPLGGRDAMASFETITLCPIDTRLIAPHLMTAAEIGWLDAYHARVHGALVDQLDAAERAWLAARCRPLA
ncbi:MAG: aminopeptidase P family protein [Pseudomonadota bacterium]